ncbi:hypothetical protein Z043_118842 [Scleropages formosus]|uniref:Uncharacterized protein n=1 Tax=Scleropages formosus TaxID=113540 RepID=A0A0P7UTS7_SCLFO|nr:hypothetical protein Z043_118842 [Scleropages formosus]
MLCKCASGILLAAEHSEAKEKLFRGTLCSLGLRRQGEQIQCFIESKVHNIEIM